MRVVVVGCGGVGGVLAARLARAGVDVTVVTGNRAIAEAVNTHGFRVTEFDGESYAVPAPNPALVEPAGGPYDVAFLATKSTTLGEALRGVRPFLTPTAPVVVCQNGLPESIAAGIMGPERVLGCIVVWGTSMVEPGVYVRTSGGDSRLGRPFPESPDTTAVAELLAHVAPLTEEKDLLGARWAKLAINCATSTIGAIGGERLGALLRKRHVRRLVLELWTEIVAVAQASGVKPKRVAGLDLASLTINARERRTKMGSPTLAGKHAVILAVGMKFRRMRSSMLIALERGRTPEIDFLNGEVVRRGAAFGVPTPVNARLCRAVMDIVEGREKSSPSHLARVAQSQLVAAQQLAAAG